MIVLIDNSVQYLVHFLCIIRKSHAKNQPLLLKEINELEPSELTSTLLGGSINLDNMLPMSWHVRIQLMGCAHVFTA